MDINLRAPWWNKPNVLRLMQGANCVKVNDDELITLTGAQNNIAAMTTAAQAFMQTSDIETMVITRGAEGALLISQEGVFQAEPVKLTTLQDTVGAGDAFSAVCMLGMIHGWEYPLILERAADFAAKICQQRGATSRNTELYDNYKRQWRLT